MLLSIIPDSMYTTLYTYILKLNQMSSIVQYFELYFFE